MSEAGARRLHPATVLLDLIRRGPSTVLAIPAALAVTSEAGWLAIAATALGAAVVWAAARWLGWWRFAYTLTSDALVIESGVLSRQRRTIPFDRVEDVNVEQPLLARLFGLARVTLETGGAGSNEGSLDSVSLAEAERLRDVIRGRVVGETVEPTGGEALFAMSTGRVLLFGLFNFSLVWLAVIGAAAQYGDRWWRRLAIDDALWNSLGEGARGASALLWGMLALALLALGVGAGLVRTVLRDHGYRLEDEGARLRRTRGLFTRSEVVIARRRIQLAAVRTGPLTRAFRWRRVSAQTLGGADAEGARGHQALAPFASIAETDRVLTALDLAEIGGDLMRPVARGHAWRAFARNSLWPVLATIAAGVFAGPVAALAALLFFVPVVALALLARRHHRYGLSSDRLMVVRGVLRRTSWIVPLDRVQSVAVESGWLQRRLGLATVVVDTAGASVLSAPHVHDLRVADAWTLAGRLRHGAIGG